MKTQYRPIAMRCNQEQFYSIKDRIPLQIYGCEDAKNLPYLAINYWSEMGVFYVTRVESKDIFEETHETFDGELFLYCCGRGKEDITQEQKDAIIKEYLKDKVWDGSEIEYREKTHQWYSSHNHYEFRIKHQPDYTKEIEALEQKAKENGQKVIIKFE